MYGRRRMRACRAAILTGAGLTGAATCAAMELPEVEILGKREQARVLAGSVDAITEEDLGRSHVFTANEALRKVSGVTTRDEEGFGLRPNIGIRGLNPTRSTKITLLEDGLPLAYAPYGDNASYFHPPIDRYQRIEVLKGANSLAYGPQTIGGIVNYISPAAPQQRQGFLEAAVGNQDYVNLHLRAGGHGLLGDYVHKEGAGARDNLEHAIDDLNLRYARVLNESHSIQLRLNSYREDSLVTYSGLTQAEFEQLGRDYNPFGNDEFAAERRGASIAHRWAVAPGWELATNAYYSAFDRDWWRQASSTTDSQCGPAFTARRLAGLDVNVDACNSTQGRLRSYYNWGVEPRLDFAHAGGELQLGMRWHVEQQDRRQINATSPTGRSGTLVESNLRDTGALSFHVAHRFDIGAFSLTPIVRHERIEADRLNRLNGVGGSSDLSKTIPGIGLTWQVNDTLTTFASVHKGFAPPRVEDLIDSAGTATDVEAEESTNIEVGLRGEVLPGLSLQAAWFHNDFQNLVAVGSIAGGSTPLSQGEALFAGLEFSANLRSELGVFGQLAYTWLEEAEQTTAFRSVANDALVGVAGNRQPYAPEHVLTAAVGYATQRLSMQFDLQYTGEQFTDFANTAQATADGQRGLIGSQTVLGASVSYVPTERWSAFVAVKNLADRTYIVDRTRGIQVNQPRLVHAGLRFSF